MSDKIGGRMGRLFVRIFGAPNVQKMKDSVDALRSEYEAGRQESTESPPRAIAHRELENSSPKESDPDDSTSS